MSEDLCHSVIGPRRERQALASNSPLEFTGASDAIVFRKIGVRQQRWVHVLPYQEFKTRALRNDARGSGQLKSSVAAACEGSNTACSQHLKGKCLTVQAQMHTCTGVWPTASGSWVQLGGGSGLPLKVWS